MLISALFALAPMPQTEVTIDQVAIPTPVVEQVNLQTEPDIAKAFLPQSTTQHTKSSRKANQSRGTGRRAIL